MYLKLSVQSWFCEYVRWHIILLSKQQNPKCIISLALEKHLKLNMFLSHKMQLVLFFCFAVP